MTDLVRLIAIAIAVAGVVDPAVTMSGSTRARLAVVAVDPASGEAVRVRDRVAERLAVSYQILPRITSDAAAAVVIGERYPDESAPDALPIATVTTTDPAGPGVRVVRVEAPREVPPGTAIHVEVDVDGAGVAGRSSDVTVHSGGLEVGRVFHRWTAGRERWRARVDAVPVGNPPWVMRVSAEPDTPAEAVSGSSRTVDRVVDVRRAPLRVMFYEPRPSWAATFIRRALEADGRFAVAGISFSSRGISARTGDAVDPSDPRIDAADVLVVGGLDRLSAVDVRALDRFMRERGGAVVLVPDARLSAGPVRDLLPSTLTERLLERPAKLAVGPGVPPLQASELLVLDASPAGIDVVAATSGTGASPVVASMPRGSGRLMISGAMDAWRFRAADDEAFDRFWRSAIAALALSAPPPVDVAVEPPLLRPWQRGSVIVRLRSREYAPLTASIDGEPIRLLPEAEAGVFRGAFTAKGTAGRQTIAIGMAARQEAVASRTLLVQPDARIAAAAPPLAMLASSHGGIDVTPDRIADLERYIRGAVAAPRERARRHPMRSAWWLVPFVGCLSVEWWMRRRRGLR